MSENDNNKSEDFKCPFCGDDPCLRPYCVYTPPEKGGERWIGNDKAA